MGNFDFLLKHECFSSFANVACGAELVLSLPIVTSPNMCIAQCRAAAEEATKWIYNHEKSLLIPENPTFSTLTSFYKFKYIIGSQNDRGLYCIRKFGNEAVHNPSSFNRDFSKRTEDDESVLKAQHILNFLFCFLDWIAQYYAGDHDYRRFNRSLTITSPKDIQNASTPNIQHLSVKPKEKEVIVLKKAPKKEVLKYSEIKKKNENKYKEPESDISEFETRKFFIDTRLKDVGWTFGVDWKNEVKVSGVQTPSGVGYLDYVLFDDGTPLALVEAKKLSVGPEKGRLQALDYAKALEDKYDCKIVIFLANGKEIRMFNDGYPERTVSTFFSKEDLRAIKYKQKHKTSLDNIEVPTFCDRRYQFLAIKSVCERFTGNFRKALLVMATGTGKTRTVMGLIKILTEHNWAKNVLFLADRNVLVDQAYKASLNLLKSYSASNISPIKPEKFNLNDRIIFSTYQTMIGKIDEAKTENGGRLFSPGHFDLIISDECHRSIYNRYRSIFDYFDGLFVGLTATPKNDIDINTYKVFGLDNDEPTFNYSIDEAVKDGYLVPYKVLKFETDFVTRGIKYSELSEDEKEQWEETFSEENGYMLEEITAGAINKWVINKDTIKLVIKKLMQSGLRIKGGSELGKTIIFAKNHNHAEAIRNTFYEMYPSVDINFCQVIDYQTTQKNHTIVDDFAKQDLMPQIAVSVDMLDTGFDVPSCLNLVFFKPVFSKSKFWQMIGRGTRLCSELIDGEDKSEFLIIDCCKNFEYFEAQMARSEGYVQRSIDQKSFSTRLNIVKLLQAQSCANTQDNSFKAQYVNDTVGDLCNIVKNKIPHDSFSSFIHANSLDDFSKKESYQNLNDDIIKTIVDKIVPLIPPCAEDNIEARAFDLFIYNMQLSFIKGDDRLFSQLINRMQKIASDLLDVDTDSVKQVRNELLALQKKETYDTIGIKELETIRKLLRPLVYMIEKASGEVKFINLVDSVKVDEEDRDAIELINTNFQLEPYEKRARRYLHEHENEGVIAKLKDNVPLTKVDIKELEVILWEKIGQKDEADAPRENLVAFVRKIVGLNKASVNKAFVKFINENKLNEQQRYFIDKVVSYIEQNGFIDNQVFLEAPFDRYCIDDLFPSDRLLDDFLEIVSTFNEKSVLEEYSNNI